MVVHKRILGLVSLVAFVFALLSTFMVFAQHRVFDAASFSASVASAIEDPAVNEYLADAIAEDLIERVPQLAVGAPLLSSVVGALLESPGAVGLVEAATLEAHLLFFEGGQRSVVLELSDLIVSIDRAERLGKVDTPRRSGRDDNS